MADFFCNTSASVAAQQGNGLERQVLYLSYEFGKAYILRTHSAPRPIKAPEVAHFPVSHRDQGPFFFGPFQIFSIQHLHVFG